MGIRHAVCLTSCLLIEFAMQSNVTADPVPDLPQATASVPRIEQMSSDWLDVSQITHMPSLHNFHEMAACAPELLAVNYIPGRRLFVYPVTTRWYEYYSLPRLKLLVNGQTYESTTCRWYPYEAVRKRKIGNIELVTRVRMRFEAPGILYRVHVRNTSTSSENIDLAIQMPGKKLQVGDGTIGDAKSLAGGGECLGLVYARHGVPSVG